MKKNYILSILLMALVYTSSAQVLNQNASWPNVAWTVTGSYNTDPTAFEADPTVSANFAFDDDDAGNGNNDDIAAESPIINLTAAHGAGETAIIVTVDYTYNFLADTLTLEYYDADGASWVTWELLTENDNSTTNDFCTGTRTTFTSIELDVTGFTPTQLAGFRYRFSFLDDGGAGGAAWEWGFCFDSPTISSGLLSIDDIDLNSEFALYPNPTQDVLNLKSSTVIDHISIKNLLGQSVKELDFNNTDVSIDVSDLQSNLYLITVSSGDKASTKRFVKQ